MAGTLRAAAAANGGQVGFVDEHRSLTYREAVALGDRLADVLGRRGIAAGASIGLLAPNGVDFALLCYAANTLGVDVVMRQHGIHRGAGDRDAGAL